MNNKSFENNQGKNIKIYVSTIKKIDRLLPDNYQVVQAGSTNNTSIMPYMKDNTGENISYKNASYCELTVLYWLWKNSCDDIIGLTHHRRFFTSLGLIPHILTTEEIGSILKGNDLIIPKPISVGTSIEAQYKTVHIKEDYDLCRETIREYFPEFLESFNENSKLCFLHPYNMFVARRQILDHYCSFLFPLLEQLEKQIDISNRDSYQQRVFGFLAERLFQTWLLKEKQLQSIEIPVYNIEQSIVKQKIRGFLDKK